MSSALIIDGHNLFLRSFYPGNKSGMETSEGVKSGTLFLSIKSFFHAVKQLKPEYVAWAFDYGKSKYRLNIREEYKAHRKSRRNEPGHSLKPQNDEEYDYFKEQFDALLVFLETFGIGYIREYGIEADDIISAISNKWDCDIDILSNDHDLLQLVSDDKHIRVISNNTKSERMKIWDEEEIKEEFGEFLPSELPLIWALTGDKGDNIDGIKGIGPVKAKKLLVENNKDLIEAISSYSKDDQRKIMENFLLIDLKNNLYKEEHNKDNFKLEPINKLKNDVKIKSVEFFDKWQLNSLKDSLLNNSLY